MAFQAELKLSKYCTEKSGIIMPSFMLLIYNQIIILFTRSEVFFSLIISSFVVDLTLLWIFVFDLAVFFLNILVSAPHYHRRN